MKSSCSLQSVSIRPLHPVSFGRYDQLGGNTSPAITTVGSQKGCYFNGSASASNGVFLPAAGFRDYRDGNFGYRGDEAGAYWSSSVNGDRAMQLSIDVYDGNAEMYDYRRAAAFSVRCVQE